jgi:hypothetical protein
MKKNEQPTFFGPVTRPVWAREKLQADLMPSHSSSTSFMSEQSKLLKVAMDLPQ